MAEPTVAWDTRIITVPQSYLTFLSGDSYQLDTNAFRISINDIEDSEQGQVHPQILVHKTSTTLDGIEYVRIVEFVNGYTITFEEIGSPYKVILNGSNNNILTVTNLGTVQVAPSNSAGLVNLAELQHGVFQDAVHVDITSPYAGTTYPTGTPLKPVNNIADAAAVAAGWGFNKFYVIGDLPLTASVPDLSGYTFVGAGKDRTTITIHADAQVDSCAYFDAKVTGTLDGNSRLQECVIEDLIYVKGFIEQCVIAPGTIELAGTEEAHFLDCWSGQPGAGTPVINCGGSGQALALRNYNGGIKITNKTGPDAVSVDLNSGQVILDSTVSNGTLVIRGIGNLTDNSTGTADVQRSGLISQESIDNIKYLVETLRPHHTGFGNIIYWDPALGSDLLNGASIDRAVATFSRAHDLAGDGKHDVIVCVSSSTGQTVADEHLNITKNYLFVRGPGRDFMIKPTTDTAPTVTIDAVGVELSGMIIETAATGSQPGVWVKPNADFFFLQSMWIHYTTLDGLLVNGPNVYGRVESTFMSHLGQHGIHIDGDVRHVRIRDTELDDPTVDGIRIEGTTARNNLIGPEVTIYAAGQHAVHIEAPAKRNLIHGTNHFYDNDSGNVLDNGVDTIIRQEEVSAAVWDELLTGHDTDGTAGKAVRDIWRDKGLDQSNPTGYTDNGTTTTKTSGDVTVEITDTGITRT